VWEMDTAGSGSYPTADFAASDGEVQTASDRVLQHHALFLPSL
jgi:hypothetical protein